jgi:wyosine [tRNA(Phe)-imidazoG37] synthetase (radical SAM superfamily)
VIQTVQSFRREIAYGPFRSAQFGIAIGVNILPADVKICSFNCPSCQYGWTRVGLAGTEPRVPRPPPAAFVAGVTGALDDAKENGEAISRLLLAAPGEPTLHPRFEDIVLGLLSLRDEVAPGHRLLSCPTPAPWPPVRRALRQVDERYMQLDAGDDQTLRAVAGVPVSVRPIVEHLRDLENVIIRRLCGGSCASHQQRH